MSLRSRSVQRSRRAGTCRALPLRRLQEGVRERVYGLRAMAARGLRAERGHLELRRTGVLPPLRLTSAEPSRARRYPDRGSDRHARRGAVRSEARGGDLGEAPRVLDPPCRGCSAVRREPPLTTAREAPPPQRAFYAGASQRASARSKCERGRAPITVSCG